MHKNLLLLCALLSVLSLNAQNATPNIHHKGKFTFYWGYNRGYYTDSNLHLHGTGYDFTLRHIDAKDRQTPFTADVYFNPTRLSIPQCNYGIGFFITDHYHISINGDHMKYVMVQDQVVTINGKIENSNTVYDGVYKDQSIKLTDDFLTFEHTNGLNYINVELSRYDELLPKLFKREFKHVEVELNEGIGIGGLIPRTDTKILDKRRYDEFHLAGYGLSARAGLTVTLFNHFTISGNLKAGFISMPDIRTTLSDYDRGSQHFAFFQPNFLLGWRL
jgi:hypothetical protein